MLMKSILNQISKKEMTDDINKALTMLGEIEAGDENKINDLIIYLDEHIEDFKKISCYKNVDELMRSSLAETKRKAMQKENPRATKWDVLIDDIRIKNKYSKILEFADYANSHKEGLIKDTDIKKLKSLFKAAQPEVKCLSNYDKVRIKTEYLKKERTFQNRLNRVINNDFGEYIKHVRLSKGYSLKDLENTSGVTASYIHRLENNERKTPSIPIVRSLAKALDIDEDILFDKLDIFDLDTNRPNKTFSFGELIASSTFTIRNEVVNHKQKEDIISIFNAITNAEWSESTKLTDSMEIAQLIDAFKKS